MRYRLLLLMISTFIGVSRVFAEDWYFDLPGEDRTSVVALSTNTSTPFVFKQSIGDDWKVGCERESKAGIPDGTYWTNMRTGAVVDSCSTSDASSVCIESEHFPRYYRMNELSELIRTSSLITWLHFQPFAIRDIGEYRCSNDLEQLAVTVRIESTMYRLTPRNMTVEAGGKVVFICRVTSVHNASAVIWNRNGQNVTSDDGSSTINWNDRGYSTLTIDRVLMEDDQSNISCSAENGEVGGETEMTDIARLTVLASSELPRGFPMIDSSGPREIRVKRGRVARIPCNAHNTYQRVQWLRNSIPVNTSESRYYHGENDALFIRHTQIVDVGTYECEVTQGSYGTAYSPPIDLLLDDPDPVPSITKMAIIDEFNNSGWFANESNRLEGSKSPILEIGNGTSALEKASTNCFEPLWIGTVVTLAIVIVGLLALVIYYRMKWHKSEKKNCVGRTNSFKSSTAALNFVSNPCYEESSSFPSDQALYRSV